jgi:Protein of unknown function (DUF2281)
MDNVFLYKKVDALPENLKSEVSDFIDFLLSKSKDKSSKKSAKNKATFGSGKGMFKMKKNFDAPLEDFSEYT